jgi:site-specific DNA-methyltransferase (adenine-specific)
MVLEAEAMTNTCHFGDCLDVLPTMAADSVDAIITDPPYGLGFMGKDWDHGVPGAHFWAEALRVAKPGAYLLAFGGTRTYHRLTCAIEDAGWDIRDCLMWVYGSGFPKSKNIEGGRGTALKPAWEPIILARKALEGTVEQNVAKWGTGVLNIDECRINPGESVPGGGRSFGACNGVNEGWRRPSHAEYEGKPSHKNGRWPANLIHDGSDEVLAAFPQTPGQLADASSSSSRKTQNVYGAMKRGNEASADSENDGVVGFKMRPGARRLDEGSAARFFYCAKASKKDRDEGCEALDDAVLARSCQAQAEAERGNTVDVEGGAYNKARIRKNNHPTVKPTELMRYLCRLVTPPGGLVLDPFMGSGSTGKAARLEGLRFTGIELNPEYIEIASARISAGQTGMVFK